MLEGACLRAATLVGADLWGATLRQANLQRADLSGANLEGANLSRAYLMGALYDEFTRWPVGLDPGSTGAIMRHTTGPTPGPLGHHPARRNGDDREDRASPSFRSGPMIPNDPGIP